MLVTRLKSQGRIMPGDADVAAPDSAEGEAGAGYIWDEALRAGLSVRNYGFYIDQARYENPSKNLGYIRFPGRRSQTSWFRPMPLPKR